MSYVPDLPVRSTRPGLTPDGRVRGGATLAVDDDAHSPIVFSANLLGGIQLSQLPNLRSVREAMAAPDAEGWRDAMDREMKNINPHDVYALVPRASGMRTFRLGGYSIRNSRTEFSRRIRADSLLEATTSALKSTMVSHSRPSCASHLCAPYSPAATRDLDVIQFDITSTYLHGTLKEEVYMEQPEGYIA